MFKKIIFGGLILIAQISFACDDCDCGNGSFPNGHCCKSNGDCKSNLCEAGLCESCANDCNAQSCEGFCQSWGGGTCNCTEGCVCNCTNENGCP